ncbi:MAG: hypothetical protein KA120_01855 [Candidatus Goldbacteria bacterium]|nr:hypothetical protein [Candidatus Goldiibacteriota bacterium]
MAEIDVDKILEASEKREKQKKIQSKRTMGVIIAGVTLLIIIVATFAVITIRGESSTGYFPLNAGVKLLYNRKNMSPEEWEILNKTENVSGYNCKILNKTDKGNFSTTQEYYFKGKNGIYKVAYSKDYGKKKEDKFIILPARLKKGVTFNAGYHKGNLIKGKVVDKEKLSTPIGDVSAFKVQYRTDGYNVDMWFAKNIGVIKLKNNLTGYELNLIKETGK